MCQEKRGTKKESKRKEHDRLSRLSHELCKLASLMAPKCHGYGVSGPQGRECKGRLCTAGRPRALGTLERISW